MPLTAVDRAWRSRVEDLMAGKPNPPALVVADYPFGCSCAGNGTVCELGCAIGTKVIVPTPAGVPMETYLEEIVTITRRLVHAQRDSEPWRFSAELSRASEQVVGVRLFGRTINGRGIDCCTWGRLWQPHGMPYAQRNAMCKALRQAVCQAWREEDVLLDE